MFIADEDIDGMIARAVSEERERGQAEIKRLLAAFQEFLSECWEGEYGDGYCVSSRAYREAQTALANGQLAPRETE